jgi:urease subunit beta
LTAFGASSAGVVPGEFLFASDDICVALGPITTVAVVNSGDRPIQVGSHFHFAEANKALLFDRTAAWGKRLAIPAGTATRFEPGIKQKVAVVPLAGRRRVYGLRGLSGGPLDPTSGNLDSTSPETET